MIEIPFEMPLAPGEPPWKHEGAHVRVMPDRHGGWWTQIMNCQQIAMTAAQARALAAVWLKVAEVLDAKEANREETR